MSIQIRKADLIYGTKDKTRKMKKLEDLKIKKNELKRRSRSLSVCDKLT